MARTIADALAVLQAISGPDPRDKMTQASEAPSGNDLSGELTLDALDGARIGVVRNYCGFDDAVDDILALCLDVLRDGGAIVVDDLELPSPEDIRPSELAVMMTEFKAGLNAYLADLESGLPVHSLADLIAFNVENRSEAMPFFGQDILENSARKEGLDDPGYLDALATCKRLGQREGIDKLLSADKLDALVAPTASAPWLIDWINGDNRSGGSARPAAVSGYPSMTVPAGYIFGLPVGISFFSCAHTEFRLAALANAFQRKRPVRRPVTFAEHVTIR